jgi:hypothetical protein
LQELLNGPQVVNGGEPAASGSDDSDDDGNNDVMDVDMAPTSSKGRTLSNCVVHHQHDDPTSFVHISSLNAVSYFLNTGWCSGSRSKKAGKGQSSSRPASDFFADL